MLLVLIALLVHPAEAGGRRSFSPNKAKTNPAHRGMMDHQHPNMLNVRRQPSGNYLAPQCVPKYVLDLVLPPVMDTNTAPGNEGHGCYNFDGTIQPYCHGKHHKKHHDDDDDDDDDGDNYYHHKHDGDGPYHHKHHHEDDDGYYHAKAEGAPGYEEETAQQESYGSGPESPDYGSDDGPEYLQHGKHKHGDYHEDEEEPYDHHGKEYPWHGRHKRDDYHEGEQEPYEHQLEGDYHGHGKHGHHGYDEEQEWHYEHPHKGNDYHKKHHGYGHHSSDCRPSFREYQISVKQIDQVVLPFGFNSTNATMDVNGNPIQCPASFDKTPVFAYGATDTTKFNWPGYTIESTRFRPNRIKWINDLKEADDTYSTHILDYAVDQTIHWANPKALGGSIDESPCMACLMPNATLPCPNKGCIDAAAAGAYKGPVPTVVHVHGMEDVRDYSDGYAEAWFLPDATNLGDYNKTGSWYNTFEKEYFKDTCQSWAPGSASFIYKNTQRPSTSWYHDHTVGLTRLNVYAGLAGFYFIRKFFPSYSPIHRGPELPGLPYPPPGGAINDDDIRELPLAIQDRVFEINSKLWYPVAQNGNDTNGQPINLPVGSQPPIWIPEFLFGPEGPNPMMMTVNGRTWPKKVLKPDTYRLRILNGCNARVLQLGFVPTTTDVTDLAQLGNVTLIPDTQKLDLYVIGNEAGWFPQIQGPFTSLLVGQAERFDVIVDLSGMNSTTYVYMINTGPESPYNGDNLGQTNNFTSQVMRFEFDKDLSPHRPSTPFNEKRRKRLNKALEKEALPNLKPTTRPIRQMALIEEVNPLTLPPNTVVKAVLLGTADPAPAPGAVNVTQTAVPQLWSDPVRTDTPTSTIEEWDIINLTADAHPIHLHEVVYQTVSRVVIHNITYLDNGNVTFFQTDIPARGGIYQPVDDMLWLDCAAGPYPCLAYRDVSQVLPGTRTRIRFQTGPKAGLFVWHCHLVEHEDNEMMVPWCVGNPDYKNPKDSTQDFCPPLSDP